MNKESGNVGGGGSPAPTPAGIGCPLAGAAGIGCPLTGPACIGYPLAGAAGNGCPLAGAAGIGGPLAGAADILIDGGVPPGNPAPDTAAVPVGPTMPGGLTGGWKPYQKNMSIKLVGGFNPPL